MDVISKMGNTVQINNERKNNSIRIIWLQDELSLSMGLEKNNGISTAFVANAKTVSNFTLRGRVNTIWRVAVENLGIVHSSVQPINVKKLSSNSIYRKTGVSKFTTHCMLNATIMLKL